MSVFSNSDQVYPKRLGIYKDNYLVLEYYHLTEDKFKKRLIPFDANISAGKNVEIILRDPKHSPFLKKIEAQHLEKIIKG